MSKSNFNWMIVCNKSQADQQILFRRQSRSRSYGGYFTGYVEKSQLLVLLEEICVHHRSG